MGKPFYWWPTHQNIDTGRMVRWVAEAYLTTKNGEAEELITVFTTTLGTTMALDQISFPAQYRGLPISNPDTSFDLVRHLHRQQAFSLHTFGPGQRTKGVVDHIRKELTEVEKAPSDVTEWADLILLSLDGAWRAGHTPEAIAKAINAKQTRSEGRKWPDWRTADPDKAIEHDRSREVPGEAA